MPGSHAFHPTVLREYDVRGIVGDTLSTADAHALGRAYGTVLRRRLADGNAAPRVCVGYDGRLSSPDMEAALVDGLVATGIQVERIGLGPTPMLYFAAYSREADGGIMVTGSHNPPDYNGFKMVMGGKSFFGDDIQGLGATAESGDFMPGSGGVTDVSVQDAYVARMLSDYAGGRDLKVAWDPGNGAAGDVVKALTEKLPGAHIVINGDIDGTFPAHHPDPTVEANLEQLRDVVLSEQCDLGLAFDGDGDRIGVLDGKGRVLWGDQLLALLSKDVLAAQPGATIIADVKASQILFDEVARLGGTPLMWKTGHSLIKTKMAESGSPLAGEMSGHIFMADKYYGFDDAQYVGVRVLDWTARSGETLDAFRDSLPAVINTPELRFDCDDTRKFDVVEEVRDRLAASGADVNGIDGVRVNTADGWWLLRASNTQAVLVARCESGSEAGLGRLKAALSEQLAASGVALPDDL